MLYTIYKISIDNEVYIGSTVNYNKRIKGHIYNCYCEAKKAYNYKVYRYIRENGGWDKCKMEIIENFECETKKDVLLREQYYINELGATLNTIKSICLLTKQERDKIYSESHKEERKARDEKNTEHLKEYRKEYYHRDPDYHRNYAKQYREQHPEKVIEQYNRRINREAIQCECGDMYSYQHKGRHLKTNRHVKKMKEKTLAI